MATIDATVLLRHILCSADELALNEAQYRSLSALYFHNGDASLADIDALLSLEQMKGAIRQALLAGSEPALGNTAASAEVAAASILKDSTALEIELSGRVAERLMKWAKLFGIFLAVPVAIVVAALAWFGISSLSDVKTAAEKAHEMVASAEADVGKISKLQDEVRTQLAQLESASRANVQKIAQLECRTQAIERNLGARTALLNSGRMDAGLIAKAAAGNGKEYGPFGLMPPAAVQVATAEGTPWHDEFAGKKPDDDGFDAAWQAAAKAYPEAFFEAQRKLLQAEYFDPAVALIQRQEQLDLTKHSPDLQELVFAWAVLAGKGSTVFHSAAEDMRAAGTWTPTASGFDAELLRRFYEKLGETRFYQQRPAAFARLKSVLGASAPASPPGCT